VLNTLMCRSKHLQAYYRFTGDCKNWSNQWVTVFALAWTMVRVVIPTT